MGELTFDLLSFSLIEAKAICTLAYQQSFCRAIKQTVHHGPMDGRECKLYRHSPYGKETSILPLIMTFHRGKED